MSSSVHLKKKIQLSISEPSGITEDPLHTSYWIAGGGSQRIYKTDHDGNILKELEYKGQDIEGICYDTRDASLWITEERLRDIVHLDLNGKEIGRIHVNIPGKKNKGLEGITIDKNGSLWVVNEKNPAGIFKIDHSGNPVESYEINSAADLSDVVYDKSSDSFYILSDQSSLFFTWNPTKGIMQKFPLPRNKFEGITVNSKDKLITVVNDDDASMLIYSY